MLSPALFDPKAIDPETAAFNARLEAFYATTPSIMSIPPHITRGLRESGNSVFGPLIRLPEGKDRMVSGPKGQVLVRVFTPKTVKGVYLYFHGGGWTLFRAHHFDQALWDLATRCSVAVVSVDYRLAPEEPYPAAADDSETAAVWLARNAKAEFGTETLVIGGESAGAHLSAVALLRLRDRHGFSGFAGANLVYGCYDLSGTPSVVRWGERNLVLSTPVIKWFTDNFIPKQYDRRDPDISPLYADLSQMPPALFSIGTMDPLLDDNTFMYSRWLAARNKADIAIYPGACHGFTLFPLGVAREATERTYSFITEVVGP